MAPSSIKVANAGSSFFSGPKVPLNALPNASETAPKSLPVPAEISNARLNSFWACATLPVALTRLPKAGRSWSSATDTAKEVLVMKSSIESTCLSVALVTF